MKLLNKKQVAEQLGCSVSKVEKMRYQVNCQKCKECISVRGVYEPDTNATVLDDNDSEWDNACDHIKNGDYDILPDEDDEELPEDYTRDRGDCVWPK